MALERTLTALKKVEIYTDGACSGNPGPGGWGCVLIYGENEKELSGFEAETTNNRMELSAARYALSALKGSCEVDLYSDSSYLVNAFLKGWLAKWKQNGWKTSNKQPVENQDLWQALLLLCTQHKVTWHKVTGHSDNTYNNRCDLLATSQIKQHKSSEG